MYVSMNASVLVCVCVCVCVCCLVREFVPRLWPFCSFCFLATFVCLAVVAFVCRSLFLVPWLWFLDSPESFDQAVSVPKRERVSMR